MEIEKLVVKDGKIVKVIQKVEVRKDFKHIDYPGYKEEDQTYLDEAKKLRRSRPKPDSGRDSVIVRSTSEFITKLNENFKKIKMDDTEQQILNFLVATTRRVSATTLRKKLGLPITDIKDACVRLANKQLITIHKTGTYQYMGGRALKAHKDATKMEC